MDCGFAVGKFVELNWCGNNPYVVRIGRIDNRGIEGMFQSLSGNKEIGDEPFLFRWDGVDNLRLTAKTFTPKVVIRLTAEYSAIVNADTVEVGCQTIPATKVAEVAAALGYTVTKRLI